MKDKYMIALHGCDDSTYIEAYLSFNEVDLLSELSTKFRKASNYQCQPIMEIKPISKCDKYELENLWREENE